MLNSQQLEISESIQEQMKNIFNSESHGNHTIYVSGEAGTGKSVLITHLYKKILETYSSNNDNFRMKVLMQQKELLQTYKDIAKVIKRTSKNSKARASDFSAPTPFLNGTNEQYDLVIIEEGHRLLSQSDSYNGFTGENHIKSVQEKSKCTIIFYDEKQIIRGKERNSLKVDMTNNILTEQMRQKEANDFLK